MTSFVLLALITFFGISLIPVYLLRRRKYAQARDYFIASEHTPPGVVQNSSIAYSLQLAIFSQFFSWGAIGDFWPAIVFPSMFGVGLYLMYRLRLPMLAFMSQAIGRDRSITVPGFVAQQHGESTRVQLFGAALTVFAFSGLVSGVAIGAASLVKPILPVSLNASFPVAFGLLALTMLYIIPAGNSGAMRSAQAQLGMLYFGLIGSVLIALYMLISSAARMPPRGMFAVAVLAACCAVVLIYRRSRYIDTSPIGRTVAGEDITDSGPLSARLFRRFSRITNEVIAVLAATTLVIALIDLYAQGFPAIITDSVAALQAGTRTSVSGLMALVLLPLFYPIVDTTNWLRIAALGTDPHAAPADAARTPEAFARVLGMYAGASTLLWLLMCMFGTIAVLATGTPAGGDALKSFVMALASQQNDVADAASWLLLVGVIAMAVLTMSAMFSATLAAIRYDIVPAVWPNLAWDVARPSDQALAKRRAVIAGGGLCIAMLVALTFLIDYPGDFISGKFVNLQLACLCAQLAFSPLVLGPMIGGKPANVSPAWAIAVLGVGVAVGQGAVLISLQPDHTAWLWAAIPACLGSGSSLYAVALLWKSRTARGA
jgi:hypothetical protein